MVRSLRLSALAQLNGLVGLESLPGSVRGQTATPGTKTGKVLRSFAFSRPEMLDPQVSDWPADFARLNYEGLTRIDAQRATVLRRRC